MPSKPVPRGARLPPLAGLDVLRLASRGGQQGPVRPQLAGAGHRLRQLATSTGPRPAGSASPVVPSLETIEGRTPATSRFALKLFGLVFHPCSNGFIPNILPVWQEAFRVVARRRPAAGFVNPMLYIFDDAGRDGSGESPVVRHAIPYSDETSLTDEERLADTPTRTNLSASGTPWKIRSAVNSSWVPS